jgi:hypothetical protein
MSGQPEARAPKVARLADLSSAQARLIQALIAAQRATSQPADARRATA